MYLDYPALRAKWEVEEVIVDKETWIELGRMFSTTRNVVNHHVNTEIEKALERS